MSERDDSLNSFASSFFPFMQNKVDTFSHLRFYFSIPYKYGAEISSNDSTEDSVLS